MYDLAINSNFGWYIIIIIIITVITNETNWNILWKKLSIQTNVLAKIFMWNILTLVSNAQILGFYTWRWYTISTQ
jgi:hypothetical protein